MVTAPVPTMPFLGLDFAAEGIDAVEAWMRARPAGAPFGYVATPNADHLVRLDAEPGLLPLYRGAALLTLDSRVVAGVSRALGKRRRR
jgi:UDP-N-acetyl-D-mannosaminuronic acid transferase (WecB/TagA/CpsF family)